jgi:hypothetical protein
MTSASKRRLFFAYVAAGLCLHSLSSFAASPTDAKYFVSCVEANLAMNIGAPAARPKTQHELTFLETTPSGLWQPSYTKSAPFKALLVDYNRLLGRYEIDDLTVALHGRKHITASGYYPPGNHDGYNRPNSIMIGLDDPSISKAQVEAVFGHELGHVIFENHFQLFHNGKSVTGPEARARITAVANTTDHAMLTGALKEITSQLRTTYEAGDTEKAKEIAQEYIETAKKIQKLEEPALDEIKVKYLKQPYEEVLGDLLASIHGGSPSTIADTIGVPKDAPYLMEDEKAPLAIGEEKRPLIPLRDANPNGPRPRDFTDVTSFKDWKDEKHFARAYLLFDPFRGAVWKKYVQNISPAKVETLIEAYLQSTAIHIQMRLERGETGANIDNAEKLNQEFFRIFTSVAKSKNLGQ